MGKGSIPRRPSRCYAKPLSAIPEAGPPMGVWATILAEEGRAKEAEELFREGLSMYAILARAHPEREDFRLEEEAFRESLAQLSAGV